MPQDDSRTCRMDGCCSAKTGANLIGMLYGVVAFYLLICSVEYAGEVFNLTSSDDVRRFLEMLGLGGVASYNAIGLKGLKASTIIASLINGITYFSSALLVIGVNNGDRRLLMPWILYSIILLVLYVIAMLFIFAVVIALKGILGFAAIIVPALVVIGLWSFFIVVVNRHYSELTQDPTLKDVVRKNSAAEDDGANTSRPQGVIFLNTLSLRVRQQSE